MKKLVLFTLLSTLLLSLNAFSRSPAVMDFVGIEHETFSGQRVPSHAETGFKFKDKDYSKYQKTHFAEQLRAPATAANHFTFTGLVTLLFILSLPFATWMAVKVKSELKDNQFNQKSIDIISKYKSAGNSNVTSLEAKKKEKEKLKSVS